MARAQEQENPEVTGALLVLGEVQALQGEYEQAAQRLRECLLRSDRLGSQGGRLEAIGAIAMLAELRGRTRQAICLYAAEAAHRDALNLPLPFWVGVERREGLERAREIVPGDELYRVWEYGRNMTLEQATSYALSEISEVR